MFKISHYRQKDHHQLCQAGHRVQIWRQGSKTLSNLEVLEVESWSKSTNSSCLKNEDLQESLKTLVKSSVFRYHPSQFEKQLHHCIIHQSRRQIGQWITSSKWVFNLKWASLALNMGSTIPNSSASMVHKTKTLAMPLRLSNHSRSLPSLKWKRSNLPRWCYRCKTKVSKIWQTILGQKSTKNQVKISQLAKITHRNISTFNANHRMIQGRPIQAK